MTGTGEPPRVGISLTASFLTQEVDPFTVIRHAAEAGLDHVQVGDHVSFHDGSGFDGLLHATAALSVQPRIPVSIGVYLLALRHPVAVARQVCDIGRLFPGRLTLGVGIGGEDRHEFEVNGVDPRTRGRRTDESLTVLGRLLAGESVSHQGEFFDVDAARIAPTPDPPVPILIGGRSDAALHRTARHGDGWLALWVSARRYAAAVATIDAEARRIGRHRRRWRHGLTLWCGAPGSDGHGRERLAMAMETRYRTPFETFERWCPVGEPAEIARYIAAYVDAGCTDVTLSLPAESPIESVDAAVRVRDLVRAAGTSVRLT